MKGLVQAFRINFERNNTPPFLWNKKGRYHCFLLWVVWQVYQLHVHTQIIIINIYYNMLHSQSFSLVFTGYKMATQDFGLCKGVRFKGHAYHWFPQYMRCIQLLKETLNYKFYLLTSTKCLLILECHAIRFPGFEIINTL